jgi:hypothetical protein
VDRRHHSSLGSMARHVSDLSDPDANWFVLLGGQDGWFGAENFADQVPLWREGRYIRLPLTEAAVARAFRHVLELRPKAVYPLVIASPRSSARIAGSLTTRGTLCWPPSLPLPFSQAWNPPAGMTSTSGAWRPTGTARRSA